MLLIFRINYLIIPFLKCIFSNYCTFVLVPHEFASRLSNGYILKSQSGYILLNSIYCANLTIWRIYY